MRADTRSSPGFAIYAMRQRPATRRCFGSASSLKVRNRRPSLPTEMGAWVGAPEPLIAQSSYATHLQTLEEHLLAGDIYQANFTFPASIRFSGHPLALYAQLQSRARARWSAVVFTGEHWIISCSPELFFTLEGGKVTTRPMKGTARA